MNNFFGGLFGEKAALKITLSFVCLVLLSQVILAQNTYTTHSNLSYVDDGNSAHKLDLYVPNGTTSPVPLIIWIHGGGWQSGDKTLGPNSHPLRYARNGYAVASLNYRLSDEAIFPAQIYDCKAAIRWLRANVAKYNLDVTRFGAWGQSAGGHLASLIETSNDVTDLEGTLGGNLQHSSRVQAVVDWYGPIDFLQQETQLIQNGCPNPNHNSPDSAESRLMGCAVQTCPDAVRRANPMTYLTPDDPPFFIEHGTADCVAAPGQSQIFQNLLQSTGHDSSLTILQGAGHGGPQFTAESNLVLVDAFWNTKLKQPINPLINLVKVYRKGLEVSHFRGGSLGSLYRITVTGINLQPDTKVLINGIEKGFMFINGNEIVIHRLNGRISSTGEIKIQVRNSNGRFSNVLRTGVRSE
ncbi:MAG: alpha/beta hydrolase [Acidobacteriota bacterium]|nr:alpha/beta hydrolase [Acidobacteriota bacterium]